MLVEEETGVVVVELLAGLVAFSVQVPVEVSVYGILQSVQLFCFWVERE